MPGERWPDKRARAVLFAGANKLAKDNASVDPDAVADLGLAVRELMFTDDEVREDTADAKLHKIGYSADCMQYAILGPRPDGVTLSLWLGPGQADEAKDVLGAAEDPNPFRKLYGWVACPVTRETTLDDLADWIARARRHAETVKAEQKPAM